MSFALAQQNCCDAQQNIRPVGGVTMSVNRIDYWERYAQAMEDGVPEYLIRLGVTRAHLRAMTWSMLGLCAVGAFGLTLLPQ